MASATPTPFAFMALRVATPAASNLVIHAALDYQIYSWGAPPGIPSAKVGPDHSKARQPSAQRSLQEALTILAMAAKSGAPSSPIQNYLRRA